jgi:hypothetical protein
MQRDWRDLVTLGAEPEPVLPGSVLGFMVGRRLHEELQQLRGLPLSAIAERRTRVVLALAEPQLHDAAISGIPGLTLRAIESATNWMSIEARGTAIVPQEIANALLATFRSQSA